MATSKSKTEFSISVCSRQGKPLFPQGGMAIVLSTPMELLVGPWRPGLVILCGQVDNTTAATATLALMRQSSSSGDPTQAVSQAPGPLGFAAVGQQRESWQSPPVRQLTHLQTKRPPQRGASGGLSDRMRRVSASGLISKGPAVCPERPCL